MKTKAKTSDKLNKLAEKKTATKKTTARKTTTAKKTTTKPKASTKKLDKVNEAKVVKEVISKRELKWIYPESVNDPLKRKAFRQKMRNKIRKMEKAIEKLKGTIKTKKVKELNDFKKEVMYTKEA